jgi:outer membrane protein insertion porin family
MRRLFFIILLLLAASPVKAEPFVLDDIQLVGLERIQAGTVFTYLPLKVGDAFDTDSASEVIHTLYKTGFFQTISVSRQDNVLILTFTERPAISSINIEGNKDIKTEQLEEALKAVGIAKGRVFNRSVLERMEIELRQQYFSQGKYNVSVDVSTTELPRNRVDIDIVISEGAAAKIQHITVVGNSVFTDKEILKKLESGIPPWWAFLSDRDKYSKQKLAGDLEKIRTMYMDSGYINFNVRSTQVTISPDKKDLFITINLEEGDQYSLEDVRLEGDLIVEKSELEELLEVKPGDVFSLSRVTRSTQAIGNKLGDYGYAFANINSIPDVNDKEKTIKLTLFVDPGKRVNVRRIDFSGNYTTNEEVLRREMRQMEAAWYATSRIDRSKIRIQRLPYITQVNVNTKRVPAADDQVDLNVDVEERLSGNFTVGAGYSQSEGLSLNAGITQESFMGTGKRLSANASGSKVNQNINVSYTNPYYTIDGVSRSFTAAFQSTDTADLAISSFLADRKSLGMGFGVPLTEYDSFRSNLTVENTKITTSDASADEIKDFVAREGESNTVLSWTSSYIHDTRNRTIFPDSGNSQTITFDPTVPGSELTYYRLSYNGKFYFPVYNKTTLALKTTIGVADAYGDTAEVPFYEKYYAGGFNSVRGFEDNSLGPRGSTGTTIGGDLKTVASAELVFPMPLVDDSDNIRLSVFYDVGNVYATPQDFEADELRSSIGVAFIWLSPVGPLNLSYAKPIKFNDEDSTQSFQFNIGTGF